MFDTHWRVKDGLFIGNKDASEDLELIVENKITRVVNCCGWSIANSLESIGLKYLTYKWTDVDRQVVLDEKDTVIDEVFPFIEDALDRAEGILVHSINGHSRSCCLVAAYMMRRHRWCLKKTVDFLKSRHPCMNMRPVLLQQLEAYERRLTQTKPALSLDWDSPPEEAEPLPDNLESEELMLRNTYVNSLTLEPDPIHGASNGVPSAKGLGGMGAMGPPSLMKLANKSQGTRQEWTPRKLLWLDGLTDDRPQDSTKLEKPAGADKHNALRPRDADGRLVPTSALKAASAEEVTITIRSKRASGPLHCRPSDLIPERFGLQLQRRTIILEYTVPCHGVRAHHAIPVDFGLAGDLGDSTSQEDADAAAAARIRQKHAPWLAAVSTAQLRDLVRKLRLEAKTAGGVPYANGHASALRKES